MAPRGNPRNQKKKATAAEKGKRKAPPSPSNSSSDSEPTPTTRRSARPRGPGIRINEGNAPPSAPSSDFRNEAEKKLFDDEFKGRKFTSNRSVDFQYFRNEGFEFPDLLKDYGLETFLSQKEEFYEHLVKLFYYYLKWDESLRKYTSYVQGVFIAFHILDFAQIMQISFDLDDEVSEVSEKDKITFLTGNSSLPPATFQSKHLKSIEYRVLFNIISNCVYPRAGGFDKVTEDDMDLMYAILKGLKMSLVSTMVEYMMQQKERNNGRLPFGMMLTRLFRHFKVDLKKEKPVKFTSYNVISEATLKRMKIMKINGHWVDKAQAQQIEEEEIEEQQAPQHHEDQIPQAVEDLQEGQAPIEVEDAQAQSSQGPEATAEAHEVEVHEEPTADDQAHHGFDHFSFSELLSSSPPHHSSLPSPSQPTPQPPTQPSPSHTVPTPQIDFSSIFTFMENQFSQLNNRISSIDSRISSVETKIDQVSTEMQTVKQTVSNQLSQNQMRMERFENSFILHCPPIAKSVQDIEEYLRLHQESLLQTIHMGTVALQDLRDNSDRMCLHFNLPSLAELLRELDAQVRREYKRMRANRPPPRPEPNAKPKFVPRKRKTRSPSHTPPHSPAHLSESGGSNQAPPPKTNTKPPKASEKGKEKQTQETPKTPKPEPISSDSTPSTPSTDPYVDKVRSESE